MKQYIVDSLRFTNFVIVLNSNTLSDFCFDGSFIFEEGNEYQETWSMEFYFPGLFTQNKLSFRVNMGLLFLVYHVA